ncbi:MAG: MIP/aquaporin family protein [Pseudomonadota bacterium]
MTTAPQRLFAEWLGTALLLATVVGSGIMAERLADGNVALALLCNTIATGAVLVVLITVLGPLSGAHFNPAVTFAFLLRGEIARGEAAAYVLVQVLGAVCGVLLAHVMFDNRLLDPSLTERSGSGQWVGELTATFGLVAVILGCIKANAKAVPYAVGLYITAAYWFTSSTSFANPAVTVGRTLTDTFSGIRPVDAPLFILIQFCGAALAVATMGWLLSDRRQKQAAHSGAEAEQT